MPSDLFGRPIYDSPPAKQPPLFSTEHWFRLGYRDVQRGIDWMDEPPHSAVYRNAYLLGQEAALRDQQAGKLDNDSEARAWRAAVACGNVTE